MGRAHTRRLNLIALALLAAALTAGVALRISAQRVTPNVQYDEAWSFASASGRLGPFVAAMGSKPGVSLTGRWAPAAEWQRFWHSDGLSDVSHIATGLSSYDVHPPLYFGLLHGWLLVTRQHVESGRALNLLFAGLTIMAIFGLARSLGFHRLEGALAALVWALSPAVVSISAIVRQYDLVALTTVLFVWGLVRATQPRRDGPRWSRIVWLVAATAAALLTHYQAVLLVAAGAAYTLGVAYLGRRRAEPRPWTQALLSIATGALIAGLLAPGWRGAFSREGTKLVPFSTKVLADKVTALEHTLARFLGLSDTAALVVGGAVIVLVAVLLAVPGQRQRLLARMRDARPAWWTVLFFLLLTTGGICLQNLLFLSMPPLLSARYLAMAWPFAAFVPLLFFGLWPRGRYALTAAFCFLVLLPAAIASPLLGPGIDRLPLRQLADADAVLIDNVGVGNLPRFLWYVPGDARVFAGTQQQLLDDKDAWRSASLGDTAYYVAILRSGGVRWRRNRILANLRKTHQVSLLAGNGLVEIYSIGPPVGQPEAAGHDRGFRARVREWSRVAPNG